ARGGLSPTPSYQEGETGDRRQETGDRRQPTPRPSPSQEGRNGNERGGRIQQLIINY
ncbi:MAG: hypothetical protein F6K25_31195, partial [Okeania sp. SIO2G4]|nr:hypothetical protein [Okeania sp. SIO2G4]